MIRLDQALVARGLARSRTEAAKLIDAQRVKINGEICTKASKKVDDGLAIEVQASQEEEYVSRAGHKLAGALEVFTSISPFGLRCLDAGASTGGFTDVLLRRGAAQVVAADVGHGQLVEKIRNDQRVLVYEGLNVRYLDAEDIGGEVDLVVADLSFISLKLVLPALAQATRAGGNLVLMVKPQFEVGREHINRTGVVSDPGLRKAAVQGVIDSALTVGLHLCGLARSPLPGQDGNLEYFLWLSPDASKCGFEGKSSMIDAVDYS